MTLHSITALDDPRLAVYRDLPRSNLTRPSGLFVAEGQLLVERLLASDFEIDSILVDEKYLSESPLLWPAETPVYVVPVALINQIVGFKFHRGVLACGRRRSSPTIEQLLSHTTERLTVVVCVDVHDPENIGSILRSSAAFGVDLVVVSNRCADPFSRRVLRTSMGTVFKLPLVRSLNPLTELIQLQQDFQIEFAATVLDESAEPMHNFIRPTRFGLVFGNEGHGLGAEVIEGCERRVTIPMSNGTDSLNVAVASGIFLHHFTQPSLGFVSQARSR